MSDWKIDPDNRRRLLQLQKIGSNKKCIDCNAPNPQWASPKFGIFICLECAGIHRSLGVHISFVRSITMDQFKQDELVRMEKGGNQLLLDYFKSHSIDMTLPQKFKYDNPIAVDYKERLTCLVEDKEFVEPSHPDFDPTKLGKESSAPISNLKETSATPMESSADIKSLPASQQEKNEAYFAKLGQKNSSRPDHLPPSQGGKYQGFGSTPAPSTSNQNVGNSTISLDNFQKDPMGTFTKGWSLFSSAVSKSIDDLNESVIKPKVEQWNSGEITEETKRAATQFGQKFQETSNYGYETLNSWTKNLQDQYNHFYEESANPQARETSNGIAQFEKKQDPTENLAQDKHESEGLINKKKSNPDDEWDEF